MFFDFTRGLWGNLFPTFYPPWAYLHKKKYSSNFNQEFGCSYLNETYIAIAEEGPGDEWLKVDGRSTVNGPALISPAGSWQLSCPICCLCRGRQLLFFTQASTQPAQLLSCFAVVVIRSAWNSLVSSIFHAVVFFTED